MHYILIYRNTLSKSLKSYTWNVGDYALLLDHPTEKSFMKYFPDNTMHVHICNPYNKW